ncbi:MAG: type II toxin-antitoxin system HicA family toxin [Candidatus Aminicenantes bacterium]
MPKLPALTPRKVIKILEKHGFELDHFSGSHMVFYNAEKRKRVVVPHHRRDIPRGTLLSILKQAGIEREELS